MISIRASQPAIQSAARDIDGVRSMFRGQQREIKGRGGIGEGEAICNAQMC
jgi:hypothetical protein